ncbi:hypothetical protein, partial [Rodentibacter ratti]|uniref:hypothetical protein n=1 Tax=Rodentibacter ratti TaxID=1906745 RepID=UPI0015C3389A
ANIQGYHLELYFAPLGVLIWLNLFNYITFSYEYCHYFIPDANNHNFGFERSQISYMNKISFYYSKEISSIPLSIFNANQHLSELSSFGYLAKKNKTFYKTLLMCESTVEVNTKWCCSCTKCAEFVLFSMYYDIEQKDINLDYFFKESGWIQKVMLNIHNKKRGSFFTGLTFHLHFDSFRFVLNKLSNKIRNYLTDPIAIDNFHQLSNFFDESTISNEDAFYFDVLESTYPVELYNESYRQLKAILPSSLAPPRKSMGNIKRNFDLNIQPQIPDLVDISVDNHQLSSLLVQNYKRTSHLNSSPTEGIIKSYQLASLGSLKNECIQCGYNRNFFDISINQNPLKKGDGYKLDLVIPIFHSSQYCAFMIKVPHFQKALEDRFKVVCSVNQYAALLSLSQARDNILYFSLTEQNKKELKIVISIELKAKYNLEPWKWGNAVRLI